MRKLSSSCGDDIKRQCRRKKLYTKHCSCTTSLITLNLQHSVKHSSAYHHIVYYAKQRLTSRSNRLTVRALPIAILRSMSLPSGAKLRSASSHAEPVVTRLCTSLNLFSAGVSPLSSACMSVTLTAMNSSMVCNICVHTLTKCTCISCAWTMNMR
jgi:hypothetical protein